MSTVHMTNRDQKRKEAKLKQFEILKDRLNNARKDIEEESKKPAFASEKLAEAQKIQNERVQNNLEPVTQKIEIVREVVIIEVKKSERCQKDTPVTLAMKVGN